MSAPEVFPWDPLEAGGEDALYKSRVLNVEEKPFRRLTKKLLLEPSPLYVLSPKDRVPTPPPALKSSEEDNDNEKEKGEGEEGDLGREGRPTIDPKSLEEKTAAERHQFREDVILDFTAFESSLVRTQFLLRSNVRERERYAAEKTKIEETAQDVGDSTTTLRLRLGEAQKTLAVRKTYDELAEVITRNGALKPRDEQHVELEKLTGEIEELERESKDYDQAWRERREQFARVTDEARRLQRLIRDEKEDVSQPEADDLLDVEQARGGPSARGTPRLEEGGLSPMHNAGGGSGVLTPRSRRGTPQPEEPGIQSVDEKALESIPEMQGSQDEDMVDEGEVGDAAQEPDKEAVDERSSTQPEGVKSES